MVVVVVFLINNFRRITHPILHQFPPSVCASVHMSFPSTPPTHAPPPRLVVCHVERAHDDSGARAGKDLRWGVAEGVLERPHVRHGVFRRQLRDDLVQHVGLLPGVLPHAARVVHHLYFFFSQRWRAKVSGSDVRRARERGVCMGVCGGGGNEYHSQWRRRRSTRRTPRSWCRWQSRPPCTARRPVGEDEKSRKGQHKRERGFGRSGGGGGGSPLTKAECDEGIPPEPTRRVRSHFLSRYLWGSSARAKEKGCRRSKGERERERKSQLRFLASSSSQQPQQVREREPNKQHTTS